MFLKKDNMRLVRSAVATTLMTLSIPAHTPARAQTFPSRSVTLVVPFAAGGGADATARIVAQAMSDVLGQTIIVENVSGAGGAIASMRVKNAEPNGYIMGLGSLGTLAASAAMNANPKFDSTRDFEYLGLVSTTPAVVFARKDLPATTLGEFGSYARQRGVDLKIGHAGLGSTSHISCVLLFQLLGVQPTYVSYRGYAPVVNDILTGSLDAGCDLVTSASGHIASGTLKAYAVAAAGRSHVVPHIPTAGEAGLPEFLVEVWMGLFVPKGTPSAVTATLSGALSSALSRPAVQRKLADIGAQVPEPTDRSGAHMLRQITTGIERWTPILRRGTD